MIVKFFEEITLHWSYLEWLKYNTAKPLLYTVYRTRNRKEEGRKWSGKKISFKAVLKNSKCWSWADVGAHDVYILLVHYIQKDEEILQ